MLWICRLASHKNSSIIDDFWVTMVGEFHQNFNSPITHIRFSMLRIGLFVWHKIPSIIYDFFCLAPIHSKAFFE